METRKNATNHKNCVPHPAEQKPIEIIDLTNVDGKELPETLLKNDKNWRKIVKWCQSCKKKWKKEHLKTRLQQNTEKMNAIKKPKL